MIYTEPPETLKVKNVDYPIDTDFRTWAMFYTDMSKLKGERERFKATVDMMRKLKLPLCKESINAVFTFMSGGKDVDGKGDISGVTERAIDFEVDEELITAAFQSQYSINLRKEGLHWWDFLAYFNGLLPENAICKIMGYRTVDTRKMVKEQKAFYTKLKNKYALDKVHYANITDRNNALKAKIKRIQREVNGVGR